MIRQVIFDLGGVLIRFDPDLFLSRLPLSDPDRQVLKNQVFRSQEWAMTDRGTLSPEQAARQIAGRLPAPLRPYVPDLFGWWQGGLIPYEYSEPLIRELKQAGLGIYLLSNTSADWHRFWGRLPVSRYFDGCLISADEQLIKPEAAIYDRLLERFRLRPEECFFIDDSPWNIEAAANRGIAGYVFNDDPDGLRRALARAGVPLAE